MVVIELIAVIIKRLMLSYRILHIPLHVGDKSGLNYFLFTISINK